MHLDAETCYRAMASRDSRFDGRFIIGVRTTGIYCRPGCPARTPKRANVAFFACAAAAEGAGLRACLRCRPDAAPGSPAALGTPATVTRALRILGEGGLRADTGGVEGLAARLGLGARHLRRLFREHLGASPLAIASSQRVQFARKLVEETSLPMTELALASGFASLRRFNDAMLRAFGRTPTELRRRSKPHVWPLGQVRLRLPYRAPLDWDALLAFLAARAIPGVERVSHAEYARSVRVGASAATLRVSRAVDATHLVLELTCAPVAQLSRVAARVRRLFDLDADPAAIDARLAEVPWLAASVKAHPGLRVPGAWDSFELAVRALLGQVSVPLASILTRRLVERFGARISGPAGAPLAAELTHTFPAPAELATARLEGIGLPAPRAAAVRALAQACVDGLDLEAASVAELTELPGIAPWTAITLAMRAGRDPDAFPAGDLTLREHASASGAPLAPRALTALAEPARPFRAYAALHLWTAPDPKDSP